MARPQTNKVDYFPHPVTHGKKMSYLEKKYGNDGYAAWFKILEELGNTDYHYLDLSDEVQVMFLSDRCLISEERLLNIINDLIRLREFDVDLWKNHQILFNEKFIESVQEAYKKRSNDCIDKNSLLQLLEGLGIRKPPKSTPKPLKGEPQGAVNPQSKVKESKVKESKGEGENKKSYRFSPPSVADVLDYMLEKKLPDKTAQVESKKFCDFYESKNWMVGKNKMAKWKSAASGWINRMQNFQPAEQKKQNNEPRLLGVNPDKYG